MASWSNMAQGDCQEKVLDMAEAMAFANDDEVGAKLLE